MNLQTFSRSGTASDARGFSLIEITLAIAIAAVALVSILGMLPPAMEMSNNAVDQTAVGTVLEDLHERIEGQELTEGLVPGSPFFYDLQGRFWSEDQNRGSSIAEARFIRADVELVKPAGTLTPDLEMPQEMLAAQVALSWPIDDEGNPQGVRNPRVTITYMVTTLTGPDWQEIDPEFVPKVEY